MTIATADALRLTSKRSEGGTADIEPRLFDSAEAVASSGNCGGRFRHVPQELSRL